MVVFSKSNITLLYPSYLLLNQDLTIIEIGKELSEVIPNLQSQSFASNFSILNKNIDYNTLLQIQGTDCVITCIAYTSIILEGKFIKLEATEEFFFAGKIVPSTPQIQHHNLKRNTDDLDVLKLESALETIGNTFWFHDLETAQEFKDSFSEGNHNVGFYDFFGNKNAIKAKIWFDSIHPDDKWMVQEADKNYRAGKITKHFLQYRTIDKKKSERWISDKGTVYEYKNGLPYKLICMHTDITDLYAVKAELNEQKHFYETILNNLPADIAVFDKNHTYLFVNPYAIKNAEVRQWIIGKKDEDYIKLRNLPVSILKGRRDTFNEVKRTLTQKSWEQEILKPDGTKEYIIRIFHPYLNEKGKFELAIGYGINITEHKLAEQKIQNSEKRYKSLIDKSLAVISIHDMNGIFTMINPMIEEVLGYPVNEVIGKHITYYMHLEDAELVNKNYLQTIRNDKIAKGVLRFINVKGEIKHILYNNYLVENDGDEPYVISHKVDITDRINAEKAIKTAQLETEQAAIAKERFLVNMSHELRTPMNGIMGIISFLEKTILTHLQQEYVDLLRTSSTSLLIILNQILDIEKIIAGKLELEKIPFDITEKIIEVVDSLKYKALDKKLKIEFNNLLPYNLFIIGDAFRLGQILLNLLSNAIKFTNSDGSIVVTAQVVTDSNDDMIVQFSIADTGIGIAKEQQKHIFNSYTQASASIARKFGGSGLGLAICKQLVEIQNGHIAVKSIKNKGTTFTFSIAYAKYIKKNKIQSDVSQTLEQPLNNNVLAGMHILVAEDVELNQYVIKLMLKSWGCNNIVIVENGKEAIAALKKQFFNVILMDIEMPVMDGFKATKAIRKLPNKQKATIPIIALTANVLNNISNKILLCGMNGYVSKPFNEYQIIDMLMKYSKTNTAITSTNSTSNMAYNATIFKNAAHSNKEFMLKMAKIFIRTAQISCKLMKEALATTDWLKVNKEAHKLIFSTDFFGLPEARKIILKIEAQMKTIIKPVTFKKQTRQLIVIIEACVTQLQNDFMI